MVKLEGAGPMVSRVRAIVGCGHPRDGPHRPDAAVGDDARRLQGAGPHGGGGAAARRGRARARGGRLLRDRARGRARAGGRARHAGSRVPTIGIGAGAATRRPGARLARPARPVRGPRAALREAVRGPRAARSGARSRRTSAEVRSGAFPEERHTYAMPEEELAALPRGGHARLDEPGERGVRERGDERRAAAVAAAARGQLQPCTARMPIASRTTDQATAPATIRSKTTSPVPVGSAAAEHVRRRTARAAPARRAATARSAPQANASMCRARRYEPTRAGEARPEEHEHADAKYEAMP